VLKAQHKDETLNKDDLSSLIRELLVEELAAIRGDVQVTPKIREEFVSMRSDADLAKFARHVLNMAKDPQSKNDIETGRLVFRLAAAPMTMATQSSGSVDEVAMNRFDKGLISEKEILALPSGMNSLRVGKKVCFTPLARDVMRQRGIKIERTKQ